MMVKIWVLSAVILLFITHSSAGQSRVVMNEIMFAPQKPEPEWIELLNISADTVWVANWQIKVGHYLPKPLDSLNSRIPPDSMVVITASDSALAAVDHISAYKIVHVALSALSNSGSIIALYDTNGILMDSVPYAGNWIKGTGISIERIDPDKVGWDPTNWAACRDTSGSTILRPNSVRKHNHDLAMIAAQVYDSEVYVEFSNCGRNTEYDPDITLIITPVDTIVYPTAVSIPPDSTISFLLPLPHNFYGIFPCVAFLVDSMDEFHYNDTARCSIAWPIPQDSLVINEIMFSPPPGSCQWMEVYNRSGRWISLDSAKLIVGESKPGEYNHTITPIIIPSDSLAIIAADSALFFQAYPSLEHKGLVADLNLSTLDFGKDSCTVVLHNRDSTTIDSVHYLKGWQQSLLRKTFSGISLERTDPAGESNNPNNWHACLDSLGATPLRPNSTSTSSVHDTVIPAGTSFNAEFSPNPFSPDGDGFEDATTLTIQTGDPISEWAMRVRLFDARGRMVRLLTDATPVMGATMLNFDGKSDNGQTLAPGLYTVLVELTSASPLRTLRKTTAVVIAGKRR